jgi:predicted ATP-binding protein involved in virulence
MKIQTLTLVNYRKFSRQSFAFHDRFTALIGDNATGKTQVLQAIATLLSQYQSEMLRNKSVATDIRPADVRHASQMFDNRNGSHQLRMEHFYPAVVASDFNQGDFVFCRRDDASDGNSRNDFLARQAQEALNGISAQKEITLPVLAFYGTSRLWNKKNRSRQGIPSRTDGYRWSLDAFIDFDELNEWFKEQELIHLQKGTNEAALSVMRKALAMMIPDCETVFYDFEFKSLVLRFKDSPAHPSADQNLLFADLSDGYRMILTMVFDIVKQMITLNPHLGTETLEKTDGIVLIDELDLSLHPNWQRTVAESLRRTFPLVQFIVTTHSPFVVQSLQAGEVIDLEACGGEVLSSHWKQLQDTAKVQADDADQSLQLVEYAASGHAWPGTKGVYAKKSLEDVAEDVMGVENAQRSARLQRMYDKAKEYYTKLKQVKNAASSAELTRLKQELDALIAPFSDEVAYHAFLEMERLAAEAERKEAAK